MGHCDPATVDAALGLTPFPLYLVIKESHIALGRRCRQVFLGIWLIDVGDIDGVGNRYIVIVSGGVTGCGVVEDNIQDVQEILTGSQKGHAAGEQQDPKVFFHS